MPASNQKLERIIMCEKKVPVLNSMIKNRNTRFLKSYTLNYTNTEGNEKLYEMVISIMKNQRRLGRMPLVL